MAAVKLFGITEQNVNQWNGMQVDTNVYVGTGAAGVPSLRSGREGAFYVLEGVQTAVSVDILLDTFNAKHGDQFRLMIGTGAFTTSSLVVRSGGTAGTIVASFGGTAAPLKPRSASLVFDGVNVAWKGAAG